MNTVAQKEIVAKVTELWTASERLWEAACEDDRDFQSAADKCGNAYSDAVEALEAGDTNRALTALEQAKLYECDGGDDQHAAEALKLVKALAAFPSDAVIVETMPDHLRESHRAARNWGSYPHNGAERKIMSRFDAGEIVAADSDEYDHIVRAAVAADLVKYEVVS